MKRLFARRPSPGLVVGDWIFLAGQGGRMQADPSDPDAIFGPETRLCLENIKKRLDALGLTFRDVVHAKVMLAHWRDFDTARWARHFGPRWPELAAKKRALDPEGILNPGFVDWS